MGIAMALIFAFFLMVLVGVGAWLLDGWVDTRSVWVIALLLIGGFVFLSAGLIALMLLALLISAIFGVLA